MAHPSLDEIRNDLAINLHHNENKINFQLKNIAPILGIHTYRALSDNFDLDGSRNAFDGNKQNSSSVCQRRRLYQ
jgi:hypothetical protein